MIILNIVFNLLFVTPIAFFRTMSLDEWAKAIETEAPVLKQFLSYPGIFGTSYTVFGTIIMRVLTGIFLGVAIGLALFCSYFYYRLKKWKKTVSDSTYKMQLMLFHALISQVVNIRS